MEINRLPLDHDDTLAEFDLQTQNAYGISILSSDSGLRLEPGSDPSLRRRLARLGEIASPVLIAAGDHDRSFPAINQVVLLESITSSELAVYPDSGHGFHMQHTAAFCGALDQFLRIE